MGNLLSFEPVKMIALNLKGKTAIVTGSTRGIGLSIAQTLALCGCRIIMNGRSKEDLNKTLKEMDNLGHEANGISGDVASPETAARLVRMALGKYGQLDILVNNAGIFEWKDMDRITPRVWDRMMATNLKGAFLLCQKALPIFKRQRGGVVVNIASVVGISGRTRGAHYSASKGGLIAMTQGLAREFGLYNVRANCVAPGFVETERGLASMAEAGVDLRLIKMNASLKKFAKPQDVANAVSFLCSDLSAAISGQTLVVDCGYLMT